MATGKRTDAGRKTATRARGATRQSAKKDGADKTRRPKTPVSKPRGSTIADGKKSSSKKPKAAEEATSKPAARTRANSSKKAAGSKTTASAKARRPKKGTSAGAAKPSYDSDMADIGIVVVDDTIEVDQEKINEERKAYLEEARSQEAFD